jgi:hypothetical protein
VFEPRYLYWADKLGYLVWGEFPNWGLDYRKLEMHLPVVDEWAEILRRDRNHPAIIGWCPFNETPVEAKPIQKVVFDLTRLIDPSRPVIETSGWSHGLTNPEVLDCHDYDQDPTNFKKRWDAATASGLHIPAAYISPAQLFSSRPFFLSEFGGIGWNVKNGWGYGGAPKDLNAFYARFKGLVDAQLDNPHLFGYCYTQLTDVEQEQNGLYTYDRHPKFDVKRLHQIQSRRAAYEIKPPTK